MKEKLNALDSLEKIADFAEQELYQNEIAQYTTREYFTRELYASPNPFEHVVANLATKLDRAKEEVLWWMENEEQSHGNTYACFVSLKNPLEVDAKGRAYYQISFSPMGQEVDTESIAVYAKENGYDGVIVRNVKETDYANRKSDDFIIQNAAQVKSATDNRGAFDGSNPDITFSVVGEHAANWDKIKDRAFTGRDDGKLRVELQRKHELTLNHEQTTQAEAIMHLEELEGQPLVNTRSGFVAFVNKPQRKELVDLSKAWKSATNGFSVGAHYEAVSRIEKLFEHAVPCGEYPDSKNGKADVKILRFACPLMLGGEKAVAWMTAKKSTDKKNGERLYNLELVDIQRLAGKLESEQQRAARFTTVKVTPPPASKDIVAKVEEAFKTYFEDVPESDSSSSIINLDEESVAREVVDAGQGFRANLAYSEAIMREMRGAMQRLRKLGSKTRTDREDAVAAMGTMVQMVKAAVAVLPKGYRFSVHPYLNRIEALAATGDIDLTSDIAGKDILQLENAEGVDLKKPYDEMVKEYGNVKLAEALKSLHAELEDYMEAVPQRAVRMNEWEYAVMPESLKKNKAVMAGLRENGIRPRFHDGTEDGRKAALSGLVNDAMVSFSVFSPSEASGLRALQSAVRGKQDAVFRSDTLNADVMLPFGSAGVYKNPDNPKSKIVGAHGLLNIIAARMAHGDSLEEATYTAVKAVLATVNGRIVDDSSSENKKELTLDGYNTWVYLKWRAENKAWVVTGYKENDKHSSVDDRQRAMNLAESYALNTFGGLERVGAALEYSIARVAREYKQNNANPFLKLDFSSSMVNLDEDMVAAEVVGAGQGFRANLAYSEAIMREMRGAMQRLRRLGSKTRTDREDAVAAMGTMVQMVKEAVAVLMNPVDFGARVWRNLKHYYEE